MRAVVCDKAVEPAVMIAVAVAQDQPVDPRGVEVEQIEIAYQDFGRVAEIEQILGFAAGLRGFEMQ